MCGFVAFANSGEGQATMLATDDPHALSKAFMSVSG
jgi:hypothetical protein